jgi:hypothetical protein
MRLDLVKILGVTKTVSTVNVNGQPYSNFVYNFLDEVCTSFNVTGKILSIILPLQ